MLIWNFGRRHGVCSVVVEMVHLLSRVLSVSFAHLITGFCTWTNTWAYTVCQPIEEAVFLLFLV